MKTSGGTAALWLILLHCIVPIFASALLEEWEGITNSLENTLNAIERSHEEYLARSGSKRVPRDATFRTGRSGYWRPLAPRQRPSPSEDFSDQLSALVGELGSSLEKLIQLISSQFNTGHLSLGDGSSPQTILPIVGTGLPFTDSTPTTPVAGASSTSSSPSPPPATYTFDPESSNLNVVYYSQTDLTPIISLTQVCDDPAIDMVILAFVTGLFSDGGYPSMNMASNCWAPNAAQQAAGATKLLDCVSDGLASKIAHCQNNGKKVSISLGGIYGNLSMPSEEEAVEAAHTLWNLFLGGSDPDTRGLRPYGETVLDGIDIDNEFPAAATYIPTLVSTLRQLMLTDPSKSYYLSAAPECPRPDLSIPVSQMLDDIDFWSVQFYNNPACQLNSGQGFIDSLQAWSNDLAAVGGPVPRHRTTRSSRARSRRSVGGGGTFNNINNGVAAPRLLIGTPAFPAAGSGWVDVATYKSILVQVEDLHLPNLAGAMFWDGAYQEVSGQVIDGKNTTYAEVVKEVLS